MSRLPFAARVGQAQEERIPGEHGQRGSVRLILLLQRVNVQAATTGPYKQMRKRESLKVILDECMRHMQRKTQIIFPLLLVLDMINGI